MTDKKILLYLLRELEARLGSTPPPSPSDRNSPAILNSRIMQLSSEVARLRRMLNQTDAQSALSDECVCVCVGRGGRGKAFTYPLHSLPLFIPPLFFSPPPSSFLSPHFVPPSSLPADREKMHQLEEEEKALKEENIRLQRRLLRETERREQMSRQLSESESSLEMDDER